MGYNWLTDQVIVQQKGSWDYNDSQEEHEFSNRGTTKKGKQNSDISIEVIACKTIYSAMSQIKTASIFRRYSPSLKMFTNCKELRRVRMMRSVKGVSEKRIELL